MKVVVTSPIWSLNGVNVFSANLVRGLVAEGVDAELLITCPEMPDPKPMPLPSDIPVAQFPVRKVGGWRRRWRTLIDYLEEKAPCIYLPNYDFWHSGISTKLADEVVVIGIVHSDDPQHYEHVQRLGIYWNEIVAVSQHIKYQIDHLQPELSDRVEIIHYGVSCPDKFPMKEIVAPAPLRIVYHGILKQPQKRVLDLKMIAAELSKRSIKFELTIIGDGPERAALEVSSKLFVERGQVQFAGIMAHSELLEELSTQDAYLMTSEYEGMPNALLEAMAYGCVPVVTDIRSGVHEVFEDGQEGFFVPVGDVSAFADKLQLLAVDRPLRKKMAIKAHDRIRNGFMLERMVDDYIYLFDRAIADMNEGKFERSRGEILPPPFFTWKDYLPPQLRATASRIKQSILRSGY